MAELDYAELTAMYLPLRQMDLTLMGAKIGGGTKNTNELKVLNFKKAMQSPDKDTWLKEIKNEKL
jgi:hypothetical protein